MTTRRGSKPKNAAVRAATGTSRADRHDDPEKVAEVARRLKATFGPPVMPRSFSGQQAEAWARYIAPAWWLDASREPVAILFCELWAAFRRSPQRFPSAKLSQMRNCLSELGLTDERNRATAADDGEEDDGFA